MILSNTALFQALDDRRLVIAPEPFPRISDGTQKSPYNTHSVDLRLGDGISIPEAGTFNVDLTKPGSFSEFLRKHSKRINLGETGIYLLEPNQFVLGQTLETIKLPIPRDGDICLAARIEGRSSYARLGMLVHFTAPTVHPGFSGTLTLEIINLRAVGNHVETWCLYRPIDR